MTEERKALIELASLTAETIRRMGAAYGSAEDWRADITRAVKVYEGLLAEEKAPAPPRPAIEVRALMRAARRRCDKSVEGRALPCNRLALWRIHWQGPTRDYRPSVTRCQAHKVELGQEVTR